MAEVIKVEDCGNNIGDYDIPIHNAIIIPEGATNGDMIKAMFPNIDFHCMEGAFGKIGFDFNWWNASYKVESEK